MKFHEYLDICAKFKNYRKKDNGYIGCTEGQGVYWVHRRTTGILGAQKDNGYIGWTEGQGVYWVDRRTRGLLGGQKDNGYIGCTEGQRLYWVDRRTRGLLGGQKDKGFIGCTEGQGVYWVHRWTTSRKHQLFDDWLISHGMTLSGISCDCTVAKVRPVVFSFLGMIVHFFSVSG